MQRGFPLRYSTGRVSLWHSTLYHHMHYHQVQDCKTCFWFLASFHQTHVSIILLKSKTPAISLAANLHRWQDNNYEWSSVEWLEWYSRAWTWHATVNLFISIIYSIIKSLSNQNEPFRLCRTAGLIWLVFCSTGPLHVAWVTVVKNGWAML